MFTTINNRSYEPRSKKYYILIGILGILLGVLWISLVNTVPFSDFKYYYGLAVDIANGKPWGDTYTSVGYPIVLGGVFKLFGASILLAKVFNIILSCIGYYLVYSILKKLSFKELTRKIIYTCFVLFPLNIYYNSLTGTEIIFTVMLLLFTNIYFGSFRFKYIYLGIIVGLTTMIKPFFMAIFMAIFLVEWIITKKFLSSLKNILIGVLVSCIVILPWCYRNTKLTGETTFVSNNGGIVLYINNNSQNNTGRWMPASDVENSLVKTKEYKEANMTKKNKILSNAAKDWIKKHPKRFFQLGYLRLANTYATAGDSYFTTYKSGLNDIQKKHVYDLANVFKRVFFYPGIVFVLIYSLYVLFNLIKRNNIKLNKFLLYNCILFYMFTGVYFITEGQARYSFPLIFFMISITTYFIMKIKELFI